MPVLHKAILPPEITMRRVIPLSQASELSGVSVDTLKRRYATKIITLSPRRRGMRLADVLSIGEPSEVA